MVNLVSDYEMEMNWPGEMMFEYREYRDRIYGAATYSSDDTMSAIENKLIEIADDAKKYKEAERIIRNLEEKYRI